MIYIITALFKWVQLVLIPTESLPIMHYCLTCGDRPTAVGLARFSLAVVKVS
jgi:hypothetical protein